MYQLVNLAHKFSLFSEQWQPKVVAEMNDYQFKVVRIAGDFIWHSHPETDETLMVVEGVLRVDFRDGHVLVKAKSALNTAMKRSVAKAAVELIQPGHRVILDSGTTTFEIARLMRKHTDVIAMTNGMNVANALLEAEGVELLMTGGHLRRQSQSFYGDQAEQSLQNYHFDMLFLGVDAIDLERGVSTHNEDEARLNRRMCEVAERIIVVTDSSKFNRSSLHKIIDTQRIDMIIVDEGIPADSLEGLRKAGVEVILVGE